MPLSEPNHIDWIEVDESGPLVEWITFPDLSPLRGLALRGNDTIIPGSPGVYWNERTQDALRVDLLGYLHGDRNRNGTLISGNDECSWQLEDNRRFFANEVVKPPEGGNGSRIMSLHIAGGDNVYTGGVVFDAGFKANWYGPVCLAIVVPVVVITGELALIGS